MLVSGIIELPFPLASRQANMYLQIFNNIEVDGTFMIMLRTYNSKKHKFWLPTHAQNECDRYAKNHKNELKKEKTVKIDTDMIIGHFKILNPQRLHITDFISLDPKPPVSLPNLVINTFCIQFAGQKRKSMMKLSTQGYQNSPYE